MGKKRRHKIQVAASNNTAAEIDSEDEKNHETWDVSEEGFHKDEIDRYHEEKMLLLENMEAASFSEDEQHSDEEVMKFLRYNSSSESEEEEERESEEDKIPSDKAWGKKKQTFYDTDYIKEDGIDSSDESLAEEEEKEALSLQQRMIQSLHQDDFGLADIPSTGVSQSLSIKQIPQKQISNDDTYSSLEREWPEFTELYEDIQLKHQLITDLLQPLANYAKEYPELFSTEGHTLLNQLNMLYHLYIVNVMFYLTLRADRFPNVEVHPVIEKIIELRELIGNLGMPYTSDHLVEIRRRIGEAATDEETNIVDDKMETEQNLEVLPNEEEVRGKEEPLEYYERIKREREGKKKRKSVTFTDEATYREDLDEEVEDGKRAITYSIARNKGLTPKRKKEHRNPRVKHRKKYHKALIKHRHVVRPVQKELSRYGGEKSGIKSNLTRSVKIK